MPNAVPDDARLLREWLASRDLPCPSCRFNLRGLEGGVCPECGERLRIVVTTADPAGLLLRGPLLIGTLLLAGIVGFFLIVTAVGVVHTTMDALRFGRLSSLVIDFDPEHAIAALVGLPFSVIALVIWWVMRGRIASWSKLIRWICVILIVLVIVGLVALFGLMG